MYFETKGSLPIYLDQEGQDIALSKLSLLATTGQLTERWGVEAGSTALFRKLADLEDGRLICQNNHFGVAWMPGAFYRTEWGGCVGGVEKVKTIILQVSPGKASLLEGYVNLFKQRGGP